MNAALRASGLAATVLLAASCGAKKTMVPAPAPAAAPVDSTAAPPPAEVAAGEIFTKTASAGIEASIVQHDYDGYARGAVFILDGGHQYFLVVANRTAAPVRVTCPGLILATMDGWVNPYLSEAPAPEFLYAIQIRETSLPVPAGKEVRIALHDVHFLGNCDRTPPDSGRKDAVLRVSVPPAESPFARFAAELDKCRPPLDRELVGLAFGLLSEGSPEQSQRRRFLASAWAGVSKVRQAFDRAAVRPRLYSVLEEAAQKHGGVLARMRAAGTLAEALSGIEEGFCAGDPEVAAALVRFLVPDPARHGTSSLPGILARLGVRDQQVLDRLFEFALRDGDEFSRMEAAIAAVQLGDRRCVPILAQYQQHPEKGGGDVSRYMLAGSAALSKMWKDEGKYDGTNWAKALERLGGLDAPELGQVPPAEMAELRSFLDSRKNLRPGAAEKLRDEAIHGATPDARRSALDRLATSWHTDPLALAAHLDRLRNDPDKGVRYAAIVNLTKLGKVPEAEAPLLEILKGYEGAPLKDNADINLACAAMGALGRQKSEAAIPLLLEFLDRKDGHPNVAVDALREISGLSPKGNARADWEVALKGRR